ncbi:hypothetical protein BDB00DRAFT_876728 [Zychaea mexicana]|uniref:uncharacterized protein n=1 Tax=Zychaea mexicana TaxID=64656 RepID=UPI0022FE2F5D|nr:uncharacterized protein BDB00DRAFT_876728 [Zychaea mexicana]KAI9489180.1 hypothetical protein BDB00DRAFT_876728 [Zychaea mexicana]
MSNTLSTSSVTGSARATSVLPGTLHLNGYHFKAGSTLDLSHGENVDVVYGYRISTQDAVVAKVSTSTLRLEREYYVMKKLYHYIDGSSYLARPLEFVSLPSGLTVAVYADEGHSQTQFFEDYFSPKPTSNGQVDSTEKDQRSWIRRHDSSSDSSSNNKPHKLYDQTSMDGDSGGSTPIYDLSTFLRFAIKCLDSLEFIHRHNYVHGQIRLQSFQWNGSDDGPVKLWNFGSGSKSLESYLTSEGWRKTANNKELVGALHSLLVYMSPEQTGRTTYAPDHRTDIYSLGIAFFVLLTGKQPFDGGPLDILNGILSRKIPLVHELQIDVPEILSRIIDKMTSKAPDDRYSSARGVRTDLKECLHRLRMADESSSEQSIPSFKLAQNDIASVFTLPKHVYGRQGIISQMQYLIERGAAVYNSSAQRNRTRTSVIGGTETTSISEHNIIDTFNEMYDLESSSHCSTGNSGVANSVSAAGFDGNDASSVTRRMFVNNGKPASTLVGVYGPGGIGKSTLFTAVQPTARLNGYIATVKFDSRNKVPYSTIFKALSQILQQILTESEEVIKAFYEHLRLSLGSQFSNIHLVVDFIPEFKTLLQSNNKAGTLGGGAAAQVDNIEARARFHKIYVEVFRAITHWSMVTLFLDDLHQADVPSLELMEALVMSRVKILIFTSYRDQEITDKQSEFFASKLADVHLIKVEALGMDPLVDFICDTLHRPRDVDREAILPLADVIFRKTRGNAFYTSQLLRTLERKKLIYFDWEKNQWRYDLLQIEEATMFDQQNFNTQLDVSFMVARLRELPPAGQSFLKWASYVGDTFSWDTVKVLMLSEEKKYEHDSMAKNGGSSDHGKRICDINNNDSDTEQFIQNSCAVVHEGDDDDDDSIDNSDDESCRNSIVTSSNRQNSTRKLAATSTCTSSAGSINDPISGLQAVLQEGYIMSLGGDEFKWSHDRISQAAAELADIGSRSKMHLTIAQHLLEDEVVDTFLVADHLLNCQDILSSIDDKERYRKVMIMAGEKGQAAGAHSMAFAYYSCAITLSDSLEEWNDDNYETTLRLYTNAVSLSWVVGESEQMEDLLQVLFQKAKTPIDRMPAYRVQAQSCYAAQLHGKGCETLYKCLDELGDEVARMDTSQEALQREYDQAEQNFERLGVEGVLALEPCDDEIIKGSVVVMDEVIASSYWGGRQRELFHWACRIVNISLTRGPTTVTGNAFITASLGFSHLFKKYNFAEKLASTGLHLADIHGTTQDKGRSYCLYPAFALQWKYHQKEAYRYLRSAIDYSQSCGDRIYGAFALVWVAKIRFFTGENLAITIREAEQSFEEIHSWSPTIDHNSLIMCVIRLCKALQGQTFIDTPDVFDGDDGFSDSHFLVESCKHSSDPGLLSNWYESFKMVALVLYGHLDAAIETGYRCLETLEGHPCHKHTRMMCHYMSLALIEKCRQDPARRQEYLDRVHANQTLLQEWVVQAPINFAMYRTLIEAELASIEEPLDVVKIGRLYEEALDHAREGSWYLDLCVIHEYAGAFYDRIGFRNVAYGLIKKAIELYTCHGSYGKARQLIVKFDALLNDFNDSRRESVEASTQTDPIPLQREPTWSTTSSTHRGEEGVNALINESYTSECIPPITAETTLMSLDIVDMASILKSSQVLSSEVKFEGLLTSMMGIILDVSAANGVAIILKDDKYGIGAYGSQEQQTVTFDPPKPLKDEDGLVPTRVINHTIHTGKSIFIRDIKNDPRFAVGPWFERNPAKSVICMPIIHKCSIVGCLLIEGAVGVFTHRHVTVLGLLCQQMGISITNAFLFKSVQRFTMANMRMIEMQKQALEEARKSKEAADKATRLREIFLANMSHEIRTPFSGFYGMISLLAETKLNPEQHDLVYTAKESCEMLLRLIDDLLNFSKLQAGKVSLDYSPVIVDNAIADVVEMLVAMAIQKRINITFTVSPEVPAVVMADANRLRQVIINLLGNAIKFTHHGEIQIRCTTRKDRLISPVEGGNGDNITPLLFEVIDSGIGISEEQRKALFVPFSQVDGSTTRKYGGTGLGLSICMQLVKLMSGTIDVKSTPSKGSNFHFSIDTSTVHEQTKKRQELVIGLLRELGNASIVVIDKHTSTVKMIQALLPGKTVDGLCSIDDLVSHKGSQYTIVIIGFFLTHDPDFASWSSHMQPFLERARCIVVMHYPTSGAIGDIMEKNQLVLDPQQDQGSSLATESKNDHKSLATAKPPSTASSSLATEAEKNACLSMQQQVTVRATIPLRRINFLKILVDALHKTMASPDTPRPALATRASSEVRKVSQEFVSAEERAVYSTQKILAAEDNPVAQKLLYKQLTRLGFKVVCANNGLEAVQAWQNHPPGYFTLAVLDHHMPQCDGVEATKRIRRIEKKENLSRMPIVTLTADIQDSAKEICMNAGFDQ